MTDFDTSYPPSLWEPAGPPATGATAGIPGTWTPAGSAPPTSVANLQAGVPNPVVAAPATPWTTGQFVQTATIGAAGRATWTGSAWVGGVAPAMAFTPVGQTIVQVQDYVLALGDDSDATTEIERILELERENAARTTLTSWLQNELEERALESETE